MFKDSSLLEYIKNPTVHFHNVLKKIFLYIVPVQKIVCTLGNLIQKAFQTFFLMIIKV